MKKILVVLSILLSVLMLTSCNQNKKNVIRVGASSTPHAEILEHAKSLLLEKGFELEIRVFDDYVLPNVALNDG